ncbi:MAG TPA: hypothetical protein VN664_14035 [Burkholderiales bacterium]|jgi:hypothetical protein|nr:hypothetical protein [Burkholderiales bacterium]
MNKLRITLVATALAAALCGCATTKLTNSWKDPQYHGGPVKKIMVVGISSQASVRRIFEDTFAENLKANGVEAVPSHTQIVEDGQIAEDRLREAVEQAHADSVLLTRMVERKTEIMITPAEPMLPTYGMMRHGYYGYYSGAWLGYYEPATVQHYDYIVAETTLFVADSQSPVWSGTTRTSESDDIRTATEGFAKPVIAALKKAGLI